MNNCAKYLSKTNIKCECGGLLRIDFPGAFMCDTCKYYVIKGKVITRCDGTSTAEFTVSEYILFGNVPYKIASREANVDDLVLLVDESLAKRIYRVTDFNDCHKRSLLLENGCVLESRHAYRVLVPLCEVYK